MGTIRQGEGYTDHQTALWRLRWSPLRLAGMHQQRQQAQQMWPKRKASSLLPRYAARSIINNTHVPTLSGGASGAGRGGGGG